MCPIVPTFTCGFVLSNFALAIRGPSSARVTDLSQELWSREIWSPCPGLNRRPRPYQGRALPTELHGPECRASSKTRSQGHGWSGKRDSNPRPPAWKAGALPLSYSRPWSCRARYQSQFKWWWGEEDLNLRRRSPADLQSAPFGHLGISPVARLIVTS